MTAELSKLELIYVLWRRRCRTQCMPQTSSDSSSAYASSLPSPLLLPQPNLNSTASSASDDQMKVIDVFKLQNMYGPSRTLFTIIEDDKEKEVDLESHKSNSVCSSADRFNLSVGGNDGCRRLSWWRRNSNTAQWVKLSPLYFIPTVQPLLLSSES